MPARNTHKQTRSALSTSRKQAGRLRKLKRFEADQQILAAIVDSSRDALWIWTPDGIIERWNAEAERLFGYRADEIVGKSLLALIPSDRHERARKIITNAALGQWYGKYETVRLRKDGTSVDVELTVSPITDRRGKVVCCLSACRDTSERKQVQLSLTKRMHELTTLIHFTERLQAAARIEDVYAAP